MPRVLTDAQVRQMVRWYEDDELSVKDIATRMSVSRRTASRYMAEAGCKWRRPAPRKRVLTPEQVQRMVAWYENDGLSVEDIAVRMFVARTTASRYMVAAGCKWRRPTSKLRTAYPRNPVVCGRKFCRNCGKWRHTVDFPVFSWEPFRLQGVCRVCHRLRHRERSADPEARADRLEQERFWRDKRRRDAGALARTREREQQPNPTWMPRLPTAPLIPHLRAWMRGVAASSESGEEGVMALARESGVSERTIYAIVTGERKQLFFDKADALATAMGLHVSVIYTDGEGERAA